MTRYVKDDTPSWTSESGALPEAGAGPLLTDALASATPDGFVLTSADDRLLAFNERLLELWGLSDEERGAVQRLGPTAAAREALVSAFAARTAATLRVGGAGEPDSVQLDELTLTDGRALERYSAPVRGRDGVTSGRIAFHRDVSRRRAVEDELRERARQQAALAALGELAMNVEDIEPLLHAACATIVEMMRLDAACLLEERDGATAVRAAAGVAAPAAGEVRGERVAAGFSAALEVPLPGRERPGHVLGAYARGARTFHADEVRFLESLAGTLASALARHGAEQGLLARERQTRAVFDGALDAMLIVSDAGAVLDANGAACAFFASRRDALLGRALDALAPMAARPGGPAPAWTEVLGAGRATGERDLAAPGGKVRSIEFASVAGILPGRSLVVLRDVSERRQLSARLALADRMVSVGTLAAGVAHELNNPLAYVTANLVFVDERLERVAPAAGAGAADADLVPQLREAIRDARDGAERMRLIIRDLKTFSRGDEEQTGPVELGRVIDTCVSMAWNEIRHRARLVKDLAPIPPVLANEGRLGQVFLNLLVNAAQAIPEGQAERHRIRVSAALAADGRVAVEIADSGSGIPADLLPRIFDPFFTTKPPGVGTGLGLSICHSIVAALGGEIQVESQAGRGATFRVLLPPAPPAGAEPAAAAAPRPAARRARILVVDDEPLVGSVIERTLRAEHAVEVVASARAALQRIEAGARYDAIVSDLLMPDMSGMDLHAALAATRPELARRMVFLTGGAFTPAARAFLERETVVCLEKPFELAALRAALARALGGG
jgi:signal transduction histidine kinase